VKFCTEAMSLWASLFLLQTIPRSTLLLYRSLHCLITYPVILTQILALLGYINWVLHIDSCIAWLHILGSIHSSMHCLVIQHTDACIAWLDILGSTRRSLHCLITYLGFYTQTLALLDYISWVLHADPFIAWLHILGSTHQSLNCWIVYLGF